MDTRVLWLYAWFDMNLGLWFPRAIRLHPRAGDSNGASTFLLRNFGLYGDLGVCTIACLLYFTNLAKANTWSLTYGLPFVLGREQPTRLGVEQAVEQLRLPLPWKMSDCWCWGYNVLLWIFSSKTTSEAL